MTKQKKGKWENPPAAAAAALATQLVSQEHSTWYSSIFPPFSRTHSTAQSNQAFIFPLDLLFSSIYPSAQFSPFVYRVCVYIIADSISFNRPIGYNNQPRCCTQGFLLSAILLPSSNWSLPGRVQLRDAIAMHYSTSNNKYNNPSTLFYGISLQPPQRKSRAFQISYRKIYGQRMRERHAKAYSLHGYDFDPLQLFLDWLYEV